MTSQKYDIQDLRYLMSRLRDPETGCPWDLKQSFQTIVPHTLEEVYEVIDTIERQDYGHLKGELGDLLFQIVFYSQLGEEQSLFEFEDIVTSLVEKLVVRHPHVFPDGTLQSRRSGNEECSDESIKSTWEEIKTTERSSRGQGGVFDDVPQSIPALSRAAKIQKRASNQGFDWSCAKDVLPKLEEETEELKKAISSKNQHDITEELGDLLFTVVNLSRHLNIDAESALRAASKKFEHRYNDVEQQAAMLDKAVSGLTLEQKEALWNKAKTTT